MSAFDPIWSGQDNNRYARWCSDHQSNASRGLFVPRGLAAGSPMCTFPGCSNACKKKGMSADGSTVVFWSYCRGHETPQQRGEEEGVTAYHLREQENAGPKCQFFDEEYKVWCPRACKSRVARDGSRTYLKHCNKHVTEKNRVAGSCVHGAPSKSNDGKRVKRS